MSEMGRDRGGRYADRPDNVEINTVGDTTYFRYRFPDGQRKPIGSSSDAQSAYDTAAAITNKVDASRTWIDFGHIVSRKVIEVQAFSAGPIVRVLELCIVGGHWATGHDDVQSAVSGTGVKSRRENYVTVFENEAKARAAYQADLDTYASHAKWKAC